MIVTPAERNHNYTDAKVSVFLAGTIDNGDSANWQYSTAAELSKIEHVDIFNPRRDNWDTNANSQDLYNQIWWELHHIQLANIVFFNFLPNSKSPITLLELGLVLSGRKADRKVVICCPKEFYRYDNVYYTSLVYGHKVYTDYTMAMAGLIDKIHLLKQ